ncbi:MAG TPA: zf-HC2 domain-containing protein [Gemmatimonadales bacterium]|nr:zf-HC2 domain-containing protein [Gemmatimonadales bacterium]
MNDEHYLGEELQDLLDGRLEAPARAAVEAHVAQCPRCRQELAVLERGRAAARGLRPLTQPPDLAVRIASALDAEDRGSTPSAAGSARQRIRRRSPLIAAGLVAAAGVLVALLLRPSVTTDLAAAAARDFAAYQEARLALELRTADPATLERFFAERGITFPTRVFDLAMMQYRLTGGRVHRLAGRPSALFAYAGPDPAQLICEMYQGTLAELPGAPEERVHNGIIFRIYRVNGITLVFWQEGAVVCVLASDGGTDEVVQLAYAKAVRI